MSQILQPDQTPTPWRETFLRLTLAVTEGLPVPTRLTRYDDEGLHLRLATVAQFETWIATVGPVRRHANDEGRPMASGHFMGWGVLLTCQELAVVVEADDLSAQVATAITAELAATAGAGA